MYNCVNMFLQNLISKNIFFFFCSDNYYMTLNCGSNYLILKKITQPLNWDVKKKYISAHEKVKHKKNNSGKYKNNITFYLVQQSFSLFKLICAYYQYLIISWLSTGFHVIYLSISFSSSYIVTYQICYIRIFSAASFLVGSHYINDWSKCNMFLSYLFSRNFFFL